MKKVLRKKRNKKLVDKFKQNNQLSSSPKITRLGSNISLHIVTFIDLKQMLDWYLGKRIHSSMGHDWLLYRGENIKEVYWVSIPLLFARRDKQERWIERFRNIFTLSEKELKKGYQRHLKNKVDPNVPAYFGINTFEDYVDYKMNGLSGYNIKRKKALKEIEKDNVKYFAICNSKEIVIKKEQTPHNNV